MMVLTATVKDGKLDVPEGSLREGALVTLLVQGDEEGFRLPDEQRALLRRAMVQGDRGEVIDGWQLLKELGD